MEGIHGTLCDLGLQTGPLTISKDTLLGMCGEGAKDVVKLVKGSLTTLPHLPLLFDLSPSFLVLSWPQSNKHRLDHTPSVLISSFQMAP